MDGMISETMSEREKQILQKIVSVLKKYLNPDRIILFGSRGKGKFYKNSDFDLAVDAKKPVYKDERKMLEEIDTLIGLYSVDIVYLNTINEQFKDIVLESGITVYEK